MAKAKDNLTVTGCGEGAWEEETAEKEKWGSGLGKGEAKGEGERGKTDGTEGRERKVWGGALCGERGPEWGIWGTTRGKVSTCGRTSWV